MRRLLISLLLALGMTTAYAADIDVTNAMARATPPGAAVGGVFFELHNRGETDDRLVKAAAPVADRVELHTHVMEHGMARMQEVPAVDVPAGQTVTFQPGGYHVMLQDLKDRLKAGQTFPLTLTFEHGGEVTVEVTVKDVAAVMPQSHGHGQMKH